MVYCGKPSRGCQMCRTRRIKCDETKPTCQQCQKSRRQCPGYKDDFDLVFRNETKATERRARRAGSNKRGEMQMSFQSTQSSFSSTGENSEITSQSRALIRPKLDPATNMGVSILPMAPLATPVDQQAPCFFMSSYVLQTNHSRRGFFDFLTPLMKMEKQDSPLTMSFSAVAMASLANRPNTRGSGLMHQAIAQYAKALKATNLALQDPSLQKNDSTLAAVLMLGFYETITIERTSALAWGSHIEGAIQLVKMRGKKQLRTKVGISLFATVRSQMIVHYTTGSKAPSQGIDWWVADETRGDWGIFVNRLCLRVAELRAEVNNSLASFPRTPENFQKILDLMHRAQAIEQDYQSWEESLPEEWRPRTVAWVDQIPGRDMSQAEVYPGRVDMFADVWVAYSWSNARVARLFIYGAIVRCTAWICSPVDYRTTPEYASAAKMSIDLVSDIIASVPYHLGWRVGEGGALKAGDFESFTSGEDGFDSTKGLGGFFCMYPLMGIMYTDYITDSQRTWVRGRLDFISDSLGLNHAKVLASFQLRVPSMTIRRDTMVHSPPSAQMLTAFAAQAAQAAQAPSPFASPSNPSPASSAISALLSARGSPTSTTSSSSPINYAMSPLQQREAMQHDAWEKERKSLIKKASNAQGDSVERLLANYLAV